MPSTFSRASYQNAKSIRHEDPAVVIGSALGVIVMIALGAAFLAAHGQANAQQARLTKARLELAQLSQCTRSRRRSLPTPSAPITPIVPPPAVTGQEATWLGAVSTNLSQRIAWDRVLREVSLVVPSDVTLMSADDDGSQRRHGRGCRPAGSASTGLRHPGHGVLVRQRRAAAFAPRARP